MTKALKIILASIITSLFILSVLASAAPFYSGSVDANERTQYKFRSSANQDKAFTAARNTQQTYPDFTQAQTLNDLMQVSNYDSAGYSRTYQGGLSERIIKIDRLKKNEVDDDFFTTDIEDLETTNIYIKEIYRGPTETERYNTQNRQDARAQLTNTASTNYDGGFWSSNSYDSFKDNLIFNENADSSSRSNYDQNYYYKPQWNGNSYNWRY
ncbi:MAG TPA: hypothetical protein VJK51_05585 [Candidatus Nanoarchaeia archaeon]|nr:hypothetical protein [Candidatus Nanoarchaeia archaeon]